MNLATLIMEIILWCRIVLSPLLLGFVVGGVAYLGMPKPYGFITSGAIMLAALLAGIRMARSFSRMQQDMHPDVINKKRDEN